MTADKYQYNLVRKQNTQHIQTSIRDYVLMFIVMVGSTIIFMYFFFRALDIRIDRQHQMLCESAKVSGNSNVTNCK